MATDWSGFDVAAHWHDFFEITRTAVIQLLDGSTEEIDIGPEVSCGMLRKFLKHQVRVGSLWRPMGCPGV